MTAIDRIKPFAEGKDDVQVVIDTPRGSRNKLKWDKELGGIKVSSISMRHGMSSERSFRAVFERTCPRRDGL